jgi:hypothetical protein
VITGRNGTITLDLNRLIPAGDHRYRVEERLLVGARHAVAAQIWTCDRCGDRRRPSQPHVECTAGPVKP